MRTVKIDLSPHVVNHVPGAVMRRTTFIEPMGKRHVDYGAREAHYPAVGTTLLKSLAEVAGEVWNDELTQAWSEAYEEISKQMLVGAAVPAG